jgi:hypothetical protein
MPQRYAVRAPLGMVKERDESHHVRVRSSELSPLIIGPRIALSHDIPGGLSQKQGAPRGLVKLLSGGLERRDCPSTTNILISGERCCCAR